MNEISTAFHTAAVPRSSKSVLDFDISIGYQSRQSAPRLNSHLTAATCILGSHTGNLSFKLSDINGPSILDSLQAQCQAREQAEGKLGARGEAARDTNSFTDRLILNRISALTLLCSGCLEGMC
jgi:hypothetical protein